MSAPKHTAERWMLQPETFSPRIFVVRVDRTDDEPAIASVIDRKWARLIAAAPDLLEALKSVTGLLASANRSTDRPSDYVSHAVMDARAAIAKATGEGAS